MRSLLDSAPSAGEAPLVDRQLVPTGVDRLLQPHHGEVGQLLGDAFQPPPYLVELASHDVILSRGATCADVHCAAVRAVVLDPSPPSFDAWLAERRRLGQDGYDEVWGGVYHVAPMAHGRQGRLQFHLPILLAEPADRAGLVGSGPVNIGQIGDFRVPDLVYLRPTEPVLYYATAALVVEIVSPGDETYQKFDFYFARWVEELLVVDPIEHSARWFVRGQSGFEPSPRSELLGLAAADLQAQIDWPD